MMCLCKHYLEISHNNDRKDYFLDQKKDSFRKNMMSRCVAIYW